MWTFDAVRFRYGLSSSTSRWTAGAAFILALSASSPLIAATPQTVIERKMDPSLKLLYRASKGQGVGLARARDAHHRLHPKGTKGGESSNRNARLNLLLKYSGPEGDLRATGFQIEAKVGDIYTGTLPQERLADLAELHDVRLLQSASNLVARMAQDGRGPTTGSTVTAKRSFTGSIGANDINGTGVIVAFIDTGVDIFHDDFRKPDTSTRIKYLLDLSDPGDTNGDGILDGAGPYGGTLYTEAQINAALGVGTFASKDTTGHGTHGLSIAAGDDPALPGMAPSADLIVVKATREDGTLSFTSTDIVNALAFVDAKAAELGKPYVANLSLGTLFSSHDGRSLEEQAIDAIVGPGVAGKAIVVAAGNSSDNRGTLKRHYSSTSYVGVPTSQTVIVPAYTANPGKGNDRIVLDYWYEGNDQVTLKVTSPNGHIISAVNGDYADQQTLDGDVFIANMGGANPLNGDIEAIILIDDWTGTAPQAGTWTVTVEGTDIGASGVFQGWLAEDSAVGTLSPRLGGSADNLMLIGKPGGAYNAVTVGSYAKHAAGTRFLTSWTDVNAIGRTDTSAVIGDISDFSSTGMTRDGRVKPEVTAPGERVMGAVSRDARPGISPTSIYIFHPFPQADALLTDNTTNHRFGMLQGTSFSAPVVTGLAARILSTNPALDAIQVRNILINSATGDGFTGAVPNAFWGYGKVDQTVGAGTLPNDLRIVPDTLPAGVLNEQYNFVLTASGGTLPYNWFVGGGSLPPGLTLEIRGFLSGKPTTAGSYPVTMQVSDSSSPAKTVTKAFTLQVASTSNLHITSVAHPVAHLAKAYASSLSAQGGIPPYGWTLAGGALPPGLALAGSGSITGTPTAAGVYPITVQVQDAASAIDLKSGRIKVVSAGNADWSVLGKSVPTVTEIVVDPNDSNRVIAATTGIDAVFESTNAGDSWHPISINNGLNTTGYQTAIDSLTSDIWTIQWLGPCSDNPYYKCRNAMWYANSTKSWTALSGNSKVLPNGLALGSLGQPFTMGTGSTNYGGSTLYVYTSLSHQPWGIPSGAGTVCGPLYSGFELPDATYLTFSRSSSAAYVARGNAEAGNSFVCASLDGGLTWADVTNGAQPLGWRDLSVSTSDASDVVKAGSDSGNDWVERSLDGGRNWTRATLNSVPGSYSPTQLRRSESNPQIALAGTRRGLHRSTDGGSTWTTLTINGVSNAVTAVAVDPSDASIFYVAASDGVKRSRDGGITWSNVSGGLVLRVLGGVAVSLSSPADVAIASSEAPFLSRTSGAAWTKSTSGMATFPTRRMAISGANANLYFAGTEGEVYRSTNRGVTWTRVDGGVATGYPVMALEADPFDANYALFSLSGTRGTYRSSDGGLTFASANVGLPFGTPNDLSFARDAAYAGRVFIALTTDGIYKSDNRGATWASFNLNLPGQTMRAVEPAPADSSYVYAAGASLMYFLDPAAGTWQVATVGPENPILSLAVDPTNKLVAYAGADHPGTPGNTGGIYKTTDGGRNWARLPGLLDQLDVVALVAHPSTSGTLWAATLNGGAFRSDDGGVTWKELSNYGTIADLTNANIQDPSNSFLLFAATEGYGVQASTDSGKTFTPRVTGLGNLYVNTVAFDPDAPSTLYAATDAGVYKSTNSGNNWTATPLTTGVITDLITDNEGTGKRIWATVAGEGVAYSPDGGATFTTYSTGLASLQLTSLELENRGTGKRIWATTTGGDGIAFSDDLGQTWISSAGNGLTDRDVSDLAIQSGTGKRIWATTASGVFVSDTDGLSWRDLSIGLPSGIPATSVTVDPNSGETLVSLFSEDGGGVYRGGSVNGTWREFSAGLDELKVRKLTRSNGYSVNASTLGARFYASTAGDGVYSTVLETSVGNAPVVTTYNLPRALLREVYAASLTASGGTPPYSWSLDEGALPPGLALNATTGAITGEPGTAGFFMFKVKVADSNQRIGRKDLSIDVVSPDVLHVTSCSPALAVRGNTLNVTVNGSSFVATPTVSFGSGVTVNSVSFVSTSQLTVNITISGAATAGYRTVIVTNPSSVSASLVDGFKVEFPTPAVTSLNPTQGSRKDALNVVITGTNFENGATVSFGSGVAVNNVTYGSATSLTANITILSSATLGTRDVTVTNVNGFVGTLPASFTIRAAKPSITSISPTQGNQGSTFSVTINGDDFQNGAVASFGAGITVNSTNFVSATQVTANVLIGSGAGLGYRIATVTNPDAQLGTLTNALLIKGPAPQVISTSPSQGTLGDTLTVVVNGTGLQAGVVVTFGAGVTVNSTNLLSSTQLSTNVTVSPSATPGMRTVTGTNLDGQTASKLNGFEVRALPPVLSSLSPTQGARGATLNVVLTGSAFRAGATVSFGGDIVVNTLTISSATQTTANITIGDTATLGLRGVTLTNSDAQASTLPSSFNVRDFAPELISVEPGLPAPCASRQVVLKGFHLRSGVIVSFGTGVTVDSTSLESATTLNVTLHVAPDAVAGARTVTITNPDGQSTSASNLVSIPAPTYAFAPIAFAWVDASAGTDSGLSGDDVGATIPIGFSFPFAGASFTSVTASSNGYLSFGDPGTTFLNAPIPAAGAPNNLIAVYWDDLRVPAGTGSVKYLLVGVAPNRRLVVQWSGVTTAAGTNAGAFQAILHEDGSIILQYQDVTFGDPSHDAGISATIGVENAAGASGLQIAYNAGGLAANTAYLINVPACAPVPTISVADLSVAEGQTGTADAVFNVTLSTASTSTVTVQYTTADGTATAGSDYTATSGTLTFTAGEISKSISVSVTGDSTFESNETFNLNLSSATNATIADAQAIGTITNDDAAPISVPATFLATASSPANVALSWNSVSGATSYRVFRSANGTTYTLIGSPASTSYDDSTVTSGTAYLYKARAFNGVTESSDSNIDLATTVIFTDPVLTPGVTTAKAAHFTELRTAVNAVRALAGLSSSTFTDPTLSSILAIKAVHINELRTSVNAARWALGLAVPSYTDPTINAGTTTIKATHIDELRQRVK